VSLLNSDNLAGVSNSVEDYTSSNVAVTNVSDTSLSVKGNDVADVDATSFVLTSRPPVALDGCSNTKIITEPAGVSNSVEDYTASNVTVTNVNDTCLSVKGNDVADVEARSFVLTSRPAIAVDECLDSTMITEPAGVELQQKIVHQMERRRQLSLRDFQTLQNWMPWSDFFQHMALLLILNGASLSTVMSGEAWTLWTWSSI